MQISMWKIKRYICVVIIFAIALNILAGGSRYAEAKGTAAKMYKEGFQYSKITKAVKERILGCSYRKNGNIGLSDLRYVQVLYFDYGGEIQEGEMIVNRRIALDSVKVFYELYKMEYPIRRMRLVDEYDGDDNKSMEADNTSCFNYRPTSGSKTNLSMHALGLAIDINPRINPCVGGAHGILPSNGRTYKQRNTMKCKGKYRKMMIHKNDKVYKIFKKYGFSWGGDWKNMKDYQHFYKMVSGVESGLRYEW